MEYHEEIIYWLEIDEDTEDLKRALLTALIALSKLEQTKPRTSRAYLQIIADAFCEIEDVYNESSVILGRLMSEAS